MSPARFTAAKVGPTPLAARREVPLDAYRRRHHDRTATDDDVLALGRRRAAEIYDRFDHVAVSFSGGKDSTVCLQLMLDEARRRGRVPLRVFFFDEEAIPLQTEEYVRRVSRWPDVALEWYCLPQKHRNACSRSSPDWWPWAPEDRERWVRDLPPEAITTLPGFPLDPPSARPTAPDMAGLLFDPARGSTAQVMGIRGAESVTRMRAVTTRTTDNWIVSYTGPTAGPGHISKVYPIYDWRLEDVWTAPARLGWDYNRAYDRLEMAGLPSSQQRCSPAFGEEPLQKLWTYRTCFPEIWERMLDRVPGVASAARYATTELYGYGGRPPKPEGMTWEEYVVSFVERHPPKVRALIATRLRSLIGVHHSETSDPILPRSPHPLTGLSWDFLLSIAMRGDFKHRKQAKSKVRGYDPATQATLRATYEAERREYEARS